VDISELENYTDPSGRYSVLVPSSFEVRSTATGTTFNNSGDSDDEIILTVGYSEQPSPYPVKDQQTAKQVAELTKADYLNSASADTANQGLDASVVSLPNSIFSQAVSGEYTAKNGRGNDVYHKDTIIFNNEADTLYLNIAVISSGYTGDTVLQLEKIINSLQFAN
jgi:hypothetical protein